MMKMCMFALLFFAAFLGGCRAVSNYKILPTPCEVLESGSPKTMYLTTLYEDIYLLPIGMWRGEAGFFSERPPNSIFEAGSLLKRVPAYRSMRARDRFDFWSIAHMMMYWTLHLQKNAYDSTEPVQWIVSLNPPAIAIGKEPPPAYEIRQRDRRFLFGSCLRVVTSGDGSEIVTEILMLDEFPADPGHPRANENEKWRDSIMEKTRRIRLPSPLPLSEVMQTFGALAGEKNDGVKQR